MKSQQHGNVCVRVCLPLFVVAVSDDANVMTSQLNVNYNVTYYFAEYHDYLPQSSGRFVLQIRSLAGAQLS